MFVKQIYTNCLAQASYFIESNGVAAVVDPIRDFQVYLDLAAEKNAKIEYVFETHFHADFVSGHIDLAQKTGAGIVFSSKAQCGFDAILANDGQTFDIGEIKIKVHHTPGHTPESACFELIDEKGSTNSIFTGDTLFSGDVGRPDLCQAGLSLSKEEMAGMLYESLHKTILPLADEVVVYPGHGPGSACGKNLGPDTTTTIGKERNTNYALQPMSKDDFISKVTEDLPVPPSYFFEDVAQNKNGYNAIDKIIDNSKALNIEDFKKLRQEGALVIDTRNPDDFQDGFVPGSINIGLNGQYAIWAATLFDLDRKIILITDAGKENESTVRLTRVGFYSIAGYLEGGINAWTSQNNPIDLVVSITPEEFALDLKFGNDLVVDVRKPSEFDGGHVSGAKLVTLDALTEHLEEVPKDQDVLIHCAGGYRSMIAASILKANGYQRIRNVLGGFSKIKETDVEIEAVVNAPACQ